LPTQLAVQCRDTDQPSAALVKDLKERGMLDDTLVIWGGEFGRTVFVQGDYTQPRFGRDHHGRCFTIWMAGGGVKPGMSCGRTDDFCYNVVENPVSAYDLQATILHLLGIDHTRLTYRFQGRAYASCGGFAFDESHYERDRDDGERHGNQPARAHSEECNDLIPAETEAAAAK
jgi:arylsulfatase A-like enzyme